MLRPVKRITLLALSFLILSSGIVSVNASNLYEPGVIYERYSIPDGRTILCRVNPKTGMDEKSLDDGESWIVVGGEFDDIQGVWCEEEIGISYESGILKGKTSSQFAPYDTLTNTQALAIATRLNGYWKGRQDIWEPISEPKYKCYSDYLLENGISLPEVFVRDPQAMCTRYNFAKLLCAVTPDEYLLKINEIEGISDTKDMDIVDFYEAGILSAQHGNEISFEGERGITRGAAAAIIARLVDSEERAQF